ncbi:acyltransferase family protein [Sinomonas humi]|uniref:Acyltransferase 3 domain-containing protein n=1 Tax=Sinomonas humi TaxID=1338436 RepID=A0A0B2AJ91_9MICC|nr:acyltransferase [Sinomonas humi]KHL01923.1 hypothetical protein LK10_14280 [Sinomonas humi]
MNRTLGEALSGRDNALNFVRLGLASAVIFWHTYPITGATPAWSAAEAGAWAVNGFFAISGFLVSGSRLRLGFWIYMWRRAARILPGFWVVLAVTAFVFAPASTLLTGSSYRLLDGCSYVARNAALWLGQLGIGETLTNVPHANSWNGSLWTLYYEFGAYVAAGILFSLRSVRKHRVLVLSILLVILSAGVGLGIGRDLPRPFDQSVQALRLGSFFVAGMLVHALRDRILLTPVVGATALGLFVLAWALRIEAWAGQLPLTGILLWLGAVIPIRIGSKNDMSYGVYIYAFPVQQLLVLAGVSAVAGAEASAGLALLLTLPLAWASWTWVERPCQTFAKGAFSPRSGRSAMV